MDRKIIFWKHYFIDFYLGQKPKVREKIDYVLRVVKTVKRIPVKFMKHMEGAGGLYEIRVEFESNIYRIFCFFDKGNIVILFNGFQKKSAKTPIKEIELAKSLKKEYLNSKSR